MFIVGSHFEPLSLTIMRFCDFWIFDLSTYHDFWKRQALETSQKNKWAHDPHIWRALHKAYDLHLFSPTDELQRFARDFHSHHRHPISSKNIRDTFAHFRRLGLEKVGHLRRLPFQGLQKRFGKPWTEFLRGIVDPDHTPWAWRPYRSIEPIFWSGDLDEPSWNAEQLLEFVRHGLEQIALEHSQTQFNKIEVELCLTDPEKISLEFPHPLHLQRDLPWIRYLLQERFFQLCLDATVFKVKITLHPLFSFENIQLSLFPEKRTQQVSHLKLQNFLEKLENQGHLIFKPSPTPSLLPEASWKPTPARLSLEENPIFSRGVFRPLVQSEPQPIPAPQGQKSLTEKIEWFDDAGSRHKREYFVVRDRGAWIWVFCNENSEWFRQGVIE